MRPHLAEVLDLQPHPEGGWFRETWRSELTVRPPGYGGERAGATAIYYLLNPGERSGWHTVRSDELWLWHAGAPLTLRLGGSGGQPADPTEVVVGPDAARGQRPQFVVPGTVWQSAEPASDQPVLVSCVVVPGFDYADFRLIDPV